MTPRAGRAAGRVVVALLVATAGIGATPARPVAAQTQAPRDPGTAASEAPAAPTAPATSGGRSPRIRALAPPRIRDLRFRTSDIDGTRRTTEDESTTEIALNTDVLFAFDEARLTSKAARVLDGVADQVGARATGSVRVRGHTDAKGSDDYNLRLSRRRARAVERALHARLGATDLTFSVEGRGERDPVAPNDREDGSDNPDGRALNRRVEVRFRTDGTAPGTPSTPPA